MLLAHKQSANVFQDQNTQLFKKYKENDAKKKYKTEFCSNWINGLCKFGSYCHYAHGKNELRDFAVKKNIICNNFSKNFYCPYGEKCQFIHEQPKKNPKRRLLIFVNILSKSGSD